MSRDYVHQIMRWRPVSRRGASGGFTLLELMLAMAVVGLLVGIAIPAYSGVQERLRIARACEDLMVISQQIERFRGARDGRLPPDLAALPAGTIPAADPWGKPYQYLRFTPPTPGINGKIRKDHNLHPLNTEYDLYSSGPDGESRSPLTASHSRDDIIWARDGSFVGKAKDF